MARAQYRKPGQLRPNERVFSTLPVRFTASSFCCSTRFRRRVGRRGGANNTATIQSHSTRQRHKQIDATARTHLNLDLDLNLEVSRGADALGRMAPVIRWPIGEVVLAHLEQLEDYLSTVRAPTCLSPPHRGHKGQAQKAGSHAYAHEDIGRDDQGRWALGAALRAH